MNTWWNVLSRRKRLPSQQSKEESSPLSRVLNTYDLTALGIGSTLGVGVYVLTGHVAKDIAGPSVVLSFLIAGVVSLFAGLCYAEFSARVPRAGSAYIYSYICVGEFIAFIIGWNLILEYVIGSASVARGLSLYLDTALNDTLKSTFRDIAPINSSFMSNYFDFLSFAITLILGMVLAFGLKESSRVNNIFTIINIAVVLFVIIAGSIKADPENWNKKINEKEDILSNRGDGGFFPFGITGTLKGAATCFYGFVGFDSIATTGEEVKNPKRAIPISIMVSLFIIFLAYFGTSAVITLMVPYYSQDPNAPLPHVFSEVGWDWAKWIISIGSLFGLCSSLFGSMFPLPRIIYAMASDALIFKCLGSVSSRFGTPVIGTMAAALLSGLMSALFDLNQLVNMMSIGTLLAYTIVAGCVIILRYSINEDEIAEWKYSLLQPGRESDDDYSEDTVYDKYGEAENLDLTPPRKYVTWKNYFKEMFNFKSSKKPTYITQKVVTIQITIFGILSLLLALLLFYCHDALAKGLLAAIIPLAVIVIFMLTALISIWSQPKIEANLPFKVPCVPLIPALSICTNIYLMVMLDSNTWIRFGIWMAIGLPIYFISCKLYKVGNKNNSKKIRRLNTIGRIYNQKENGISNQNGTVLTIPEITIEPPSPADKEPNKIITIESKTKETQVNNERRDSIDSNDFNNAVNELDKVLNSQDDFDDDNIIILENDYKNSIFVKNPDVRSIISTESQYLESKSISSADSDSAHSEEHHIEAVIHQEDSDEVTDEDENKVENKINIENEIDKIENVVTNENDNKVEDQIINFNNENNNDSMQMSKNNTTDNSKNSIPVPPPLPEIPIFNVISNKPITHFPKIEISAYNPLTKSLENASRKPNKNTLLTQENLNSVVLRHTSPRIRTESISSEGPTDNIRSGTQQHSKLINKLNNLLKNRKQPTIYSTKSWTEDSIQTSEIEKQIELLDEVIQNYEDNMKDIPEDFGKTKEFKETLNTLLLRKQSTITNKPEYVKKYEKNDKNNGNTLKSDEIKHKRLMANTLNSIKLRKTGLLEIDQQENDDDDNKEDKNDKVGKKNYVEKQPQEKEKFQLDPEKDKEEHKKLMIATLRHIKLRRTRLPLTDEDKTSEINTDNNEILNDNTESNR